MSLLKGKHLLIGNLSHFPFYLQSKPSSTAKISVGIATGSSGVRAFTWHFLRCPTFLLLF